MSVLNPHGAGQAGLGEIQVFGGGIDRAAVRDGNDIFQLLKRHGSFPPCF